MSTVQRFESVSMRIREDFLALRAAEPERFERRLSLSWSNWGFGVEPLERALERLASAQVPFIELHGNLYGDGLGYRVDDVTRDLADYGLHTSGVCGMFSYDNDLSSNLPSQRQRAMDYIARQVPFTRAAGGRYLLVVPGAVGRPTPYDSSEWDRSVESLRAMGDLFVEHDVLCAIEPIRSDEVSFVHSVADALAFIDAVQHPGVQHINWDVFHMQRSEAHFGQAILDAGDRLVNLHLADSNRRALGAGSMDLDTVIRALYLIGHNVDGRYVTPEPLGPGAAPYQAMWGKADPHDLDRLVGDSISYFREREDAVLQNA